MKKNYCFYYKFGYGNDDDTIDSNDRHLYAWDDGWCNNISVNICSLGFFQTNKPLVVVIMYIYTKKRFMNRKQSYRRLID